MRIFAHVYRLLAEIRQLPRDQRGPMRSLLGTLIDQLTRHLHDNRQLTARSTR